MSSTIRLMRGTRAKVDALALARGLVDGTPIFITDEQRYAVATGVNSYRVFKRGGVQFAVSTQNNSGASDSAINWSSVALNDGGGFNGSTLFVAPLAGLYMLTAMVVVDSTAAAGWYILDVRKSGGASGNQVAGGTTKAASAFASLVATGAMWLDAGQSVSVAVQGGANVLYTVAPDCHRYNKFSGFLVD